MKFRHEALKDYWCVDNEVKLPGPLQSRGLEMRHEDVESVVFPCHGQDPESDRRPETAVCNHLLPDPAEPIRECQVLHGTLLAVPSGYPAGEACAALCRQQLISFAEDAGLGKEFWEIVSVQGGSEYSVKEFESEAAAKLAWQQTGPNHRLYHVKDAVATRIAEQ